MSVYVRLGIRLLYKGLRSGTMEKQKSNMPFFSSNFSQTTAPLFERETRSEIRQSPVRTRNQRIRGVPSTEPRRSPPSTGGIQNVLMSCRTD
jgi:hypothetical protein